MQCRSNRFSLRNFPLGFSKKQAPSAPSGFAPCRRWRPGVSAGLLGLWPKRSAYRSADAPPPPSPRAAFRRPRGVGRLIGPLAHTLGLQERGCAPFAFASCRRWRPGGSAGLLGLWPKRSAYRSAGALPSPPNRRWRPGGSAGLSGLWPIRSAYRSANALPSPSPRAAFRRPGGSAGVLGLWPKRSAYRSADAPPPPSPRAAFRRPGGGSAGLLGLWPKRSAYRSADAPPSPSPRAAVGGPGGGRLIGPLAQTLGLQERGCAPSAFATCRLSPARGVGRLIGPLAQTLGLQERGRAPFAPCRLLNRTRKNGQ